MLHNRCGLVCGSIRRLSFRCGARHDGSVLFAPLAFHLFQFRFSDHRFKTRTEMVRNAPHFRDPPARCAQRHRQIFRADDDDRHDHNQQQF